MLVTLLGIVTLIGWLLFKPDGKYGAVRLITFTQPENAYFPMLVTLAGIVTLASPLQPENA